MASFIAKAVVAPNGGSGNPDDLWAGSSHRAFLLVRRGKPERPLLGRAGDGHLLQARALSSGPKGSSPAAPRPPTARPAPSAAIRWPSSSSTPSRSRSTGPDASGRAARADMIRSCSCPRISSASRKRTTRSRRAGSRSFPSPTSGRSRTASARRTVRPPSSRPRTTSSSTTTSSTRSPIGSASTRSRPGCRTTWSRPPAWQELEAAVAGLVAKDKFVLTLGGEHSIARGPIAAHAARYSNLSILHFDAHGDLRDEYEGQKFSHACAARRWVELDLPTVQVGIRSISREEVEFVRSKGNIRVVSNREMHHSDEWMDGAFGLLNDDVYVTFDVDFFDGSLVPGTGTPEPGGGNLRPGAADPAPRRGRPPDRRRRRRRALAGGRQPCSRLHDRQALLQTAVLRALPGESPPTRCSRRPRRLGLERRDVLAPGTACSATLSPTPSKQ